MDWDGDTYGDARCGGTDCNDYDPTAYPGAPEVCGGGRDDDCDGVPDDGLSCITSDAAPIAPLVTGECGADFYQYDSPAGGSANPVPDIRRSGKVVVAVHDGPSGTCAGSSVAVIVDDTGDGSGGSLSLRWTSDPAAVAGAVVSDDPPECRYSAAFGTGLCDWSWAPCCTDGVLIGEYPGDFCVVLTFSAAVGVDEVRVLDGAGGYLSPGFDEDITICRRTVPEVP